MTSHGTVPFTILTCVSVALVPGDDASMTTMPSSVDTPIPIPIMDWQDPRPFRGFGRVFRPSRCLMGCRFGNAPFDCTCPRRPEYTCAQLKCTDNKVCKVLFGRFPRCVREQAVCELSKDAGTCSELVHRFYYNKATRRCEEFHYGGCGGNENNFRNKRACMRTCRKRGAFFNRP
ncbi:eppin-like [Haliotis rufescens]|uniref:eppin-like n=1 Tax=Haliotis rufescens TaxID=6454 RepID=UPI00201E85F3|nr:eppin-like [Haliotis rufescens]